MTAAGVLRDGREPGSLPFAMRTSETDPLRIDAVAVPGGGAVGLTICPGKKQPVATTGPWDRDLDLDLDRLAAGGWSVLVTLMEPEELLRRVNVPPERIESGAAARGIEWHFLPIEDVSVPDAAFERLWLLSGPRLRRTLGGGGRIAVHCRGGLGRSGLVASRLLVEIGWSPDEALAAVRAARPGAVETDAQERHVLGARRPPDGRPLDRAVACLVAGAAGDALGAPVEFNRLADIRRQFGPQGVTGHLPDGRGVARITDDTQMLMFTAEGLVRAFLHDDPDPAAAVWRAYRRWLRTQTGPRGGAPDGWLLEQPDLWSRRAPGNTCLGALMSGRMGTFAAPLNRSKGCGGIMRVAPVGLVADRIGDTAAVFALGTATAVATHGHPSGYLPAGFFAAVIAQVAAGAGLSAALDDATEVLRRHEGHEETLAAVGAARRLAAGRPPEPDEIAALGEGWVGEEALAIALFCVLAQPDPRAAILLAANHDGDTDSTAAIAGNLIGAMHGPAALPPDLWRPLELLHPLIEIATDLAAGSADLGRYPRGGAEGAASAAGEAPRAGR